MNQYRTKMSPFDAFIISVGLIHWLCFPPLTLSLLSSSYTHTRVLSPHLLTHLYLSGTFDLIMFFLMILCLCAVWNIKWDNESRNYFYAYELKWAWWKNLHIPVYCRWISESEMKCWTVLECRIFAHIIEVNSFSVYLWQFMLNALAMCHLL